MGVSEIPNKFIPPRKRYSTIAPMPKTPPSPSSPEPTNSETKPNSSPEPACSSHRRIYLKPDNELDTNFHNARPTSARNKPFPNSNNLYNNLPWLPGSGDQRLDDERCWSSSWVGHLEGRKLTLNESDDNGSFEIHTSLDPDYLNQSLETISKDFVDIYPDKFNKTTTSSSSSPSSKLVGAGIKNMGNTCFMSAILQCFTHISQFVLGIRYCTHSFAPCDVKGFCVLCAFRKHIDAALKPSRSVVIPTFLIENLKLTDFLPNFVRYQQEDAHEFMHSVLEKLQVYFSNGEENIVDHIFGGEIVSMLRCCKCGYSSESFERTINFSLHIENLSTIQSVMESFTMVEELDEARCCCCNQREVLERRYMLHKVPAVAALHLKRFKGYATSIEKIDSPISFSLELDMQPYTSGNGSDNKLRFATPLQRPRSTSFMALLKYDLYAVVVHKGSTPNSGHYVCYVRSDTNIWHLMDDSKVCRVSEVEVLNAQAYILFYTQQGTPWFSSIVENEETDPIRRSLDCEDCDFAIQD